MLNGAFRHGGRLGLVLASLILGAQVAFAQQQVQITTKLETRPEMLIGEVYLFLVAEEKANLKLTKEPAYQSSNPRYMKAPIGNSPTKGNLAVVVDEAEGKAPRVYVDANNNGDYVRRRQP
jgi:hypothetical protein